MHLRVVQKRSSFLVRGDNGALASEADFLAEYAWDGDDEGEEEQGGHDDEGEDPLEGDDLGGELSDAEGCS